MSSATRNRTPPRRSSSPWKTATSLQSTEASTKLFDAYLRSWDEPEVYAMSHIGFGLHPNAQWTALSFYEKNETLGMDARCFRGNFLLSTGPNRWTGRWVEAHLDMALRGCTVSLDEEPVISDGSL